MGIACDFDRAADGAQIVRAVPSVTSLKFRDTQVVQSECLVLDLNYH